MGAVRLILALSVLCAHSGESIAGFRMLPADMAVQFFYMISGFYMAMVLNEKYRETSDYGTFLQQRFFRLFPTYFVIFTLSLGVETLAWMLNRSNTGFYSVYQHHALSPSTLLVLLTVNLFVLGQDVMMFLSINAHGNLYWTAHSLSEPLPAYRLLVVPQAWSLGVELVFYLLAPLILRKSIYIQIVLLATSLILRISCYFAFHLQSDPWTYRFFPFELSYFLSGSLAYQIGIRWRYVSDNVIRKAYWIKWGFFLILVTYRAWSGGSMALHYCMAICFCPLLPFFFLGSKSSRFDKLIGELSYPLYLVHILIIGYTMPRLMHFPEELRGLLVAAASIAVAYPICRYIDYPVEHYRHRLLTSKNRPHGSSSLSA